MHFKSFHSVTTAVLFLCRELRNQDKKETLKMVASYYEQVSMLI